MSAEPLKVHPANPRYFADESGRAIYLTGSHTWNNFQNNSVYPRVDYERYLDFLKKYNHNFIRLWVWEQAGWDPYTIDRTSVDPLPYQRTGPGLALDGKPKFDLERFNQEYFDRLRSRITAAESRGIYVSIMLFEGWSNRKMDLDGRKKHLPGNPWLGHPFNRENNINGIDGDANGNGEGEEFHNLSVPGVTHLQEAYVRKVIDTVNDLNNVLYEIANEAHIDTRDWQYHIVNYIKDYESGKPKQHPVGMTAFYAGREGAMKALLEGPADWISPQTAGGKYKYDSDPPVADGQKVIIVDTDHIFGVGGSGRWVWKSFCRGMNPIFMDPTDEPTHWRERMALSDLESTRKAMGNTLTYASRMNLAVVTPQNELSSTGYCLANTGSEYLIHQPESGQFTIDLQAFPEKTFLVEWFDTETGDTVSAAPIAGGRIVAIEPPFDGPAVLYLMNIE